MERVTTWRGRILMVVLGIAIGLTARWISNAVAVEGGDGLDGQGQATERFT